MRKDMGVQHNQRSRHSALHSLFLGFLSSLCPLCLCGESLFANPPVASYVFPAGGQRGTTVNVRVGGLFLHSRCGLDLAGPGIDAPREVKRAPARWFEGPLLPIPESQQAEDYPVEMAATVRIAADAAAGPRPARLWTAQGAASGPVFVVGELPEVVENEIAGDPLPERVTLPVTINGRIFPREDVDLWSFAAKKGEAVTARVLAGQLGSPLDPRLTIEDDGGRVLAENDPWPVGCDASARFTAPADGVYRVRICDARFLGGPAYVYRLTLTTDPVAAAVKPAHEAVSAAVPGDFTGRIDRPGKVDEWPVTLHKGEAYEFDLHARRLESPLFGVLALYDPAGKELARADAVTAGQDPQFRFTAPADGAYRLRVADRFASRGGPAFVYRVHVSRAGMAAPDFRLELPADTLNLPSGGSAKLKVSAERLGGFTGPITLALDGLPPGVTASPATVGEKQTVAEVTLQAHADAPVDAARVTVHGTATRAGQAVTRAAHVPSAKGLPERDTVLVAVTLATPFVIVPDFQMRFGPRGSVFLRHYRIDRKGYDGPLEVSLADRQARHLQGVTGPVLTIPPGASEFDYPISLPPWMETGRTCRVCVMAVGTLRDAAGKEHAVSFSATEQNYQIILVVGPGRLGVETTRASLRVTPAGAVELPVRVQRGKGLAGPARVALILPEHWHGITTAPVEIPADRSEGVLTVRFAADARGPFTTAATLRATVTDQGRPVTAEAKVEFLPPE
jgi:hypothetical protein